MALRRYIEIEHKNEKQRIDFPRNLEMTIRFTQRGEPRVETRVLENGLIFRDILGNPRVENKTDGKRDVYIGTALLEQDNVRTITDQAYIKIGTLKVRYYESQ